MRTTTLGELGNNLPIGILQGENKNVLQKAFELRPFKTRVDRHLGKWKLANASKYDEGQMTSSLVAKLLSLLLINVGDSAFPLDPEGDSPPESEVKLYNWHADDVMVAYLRARINALGPEMQLAMSCANPNCDYHTDAAIFDLNTTEVRVAENIEDLFSWVDLHEPFVCRDGKTVIKRVKLGPVMWSSLCQPGVLLNAAMGGFDSRSMQDSIHAINGGEPYKMTPGEIDEIGKRDFLRLEQQAQEHSAGAAMQTTVICPKCGFPNVNALQWSYDDFFGLSSLSET